MPLMYYLMCHWLVMVISKQLTQRYSSQSTHRKGQLPLGPAQGAQKPEQTPRLCPCKLAH